MNGYTQGAYREITESLSYKKNGFNKFLSLFRGLIYAILSLSEEVNRYGVLISGKRYNPATNIFEKVEE